MTQITTVISDFGGVLTTPLMDAFAAINAADGLDEHALGTALRRAAEHDGVHPLAELECGRITERAFLDRVMDQLRADIGRDVALHAFAERYFAELRPNTRMLDELARLRARGYRLALLTNNVREWEPRWRAMLPVDDLFEIVVDSAFVGVRKPDPAIYELTLDRLGVSAGECLFVDDLERNCTAAQALGMAVVQFRTTDQALADMRSVIEGAAG